MRIRKRLALCSIPTTPPLPDLHLPRSEAAPPSPQPCDPPKPPPGQNSRWAEEKMKRKQYFADDHDNTNNDIRKIVNICDGGEGLNTNLQPWCSKIVESGCAEDYKLVPLKKRKGIFERNDPPASAKMKSKTNKKCGDDIVVNSCCAQKSKRGNVIMEGSRCSRVNGRGWRCCQPTLVGYSLCEHHLGKGKPRLTRKNEGDSQPLSVPVATKKRTKVGMVKARSINSLLTQI